MTIGSGPNTVDLIQKQTILLQTRLSTALEEERHNNFTPLKVVMVHQDHIPNMLNRYYYDAQVYAGNKYSMSTILTTSGALLIEGHRPKVAVIDSGASSIILGKKFASKIDKCRPTNLVTSDTFC